MTSLPDAPRLLFVGGARAVSHSRDIVTDALTQARDRGIRTHIINRAETLDVTADVNALADEVSVVDPDDPAACVRWARERLARGERFDLVIGLRDTVLASAADVAAVVGAPGNPPDAARRARTKDTCRTALAAAGFRQPAVRLCHGLDDAVAFVAEAPGPWVVKPRDSTASIGVRKVTAPADLRAAVEALPSQDEFLVEQFVEGPEFSVEGVFLGGRPHVLAVTAKTKLPPPHFVEIGHVLPADLPEPGRRRIDDEVTSALTALGLRFGPFHVELWLTAEGVVLGEVHARPGGDWLHRLLTYAVPGLEMFGPIYDDALGRPVAPAPPVTRAAAAYFLAPAPGRLTEVRGWSGLLAHPAVLHAELTVRPGDVLPATHRESSDRAGAVVVGAETSAEARALALKLAGSIEFVTG
ncbi:ATP-grasp domain-containing protein [Actinomadura litoris]|uniref:ATP-grasp domain-containing protein n=1 Tax=Actinomadura litoris TaxID=2678616 RepID=UPI001FA7292A|nr:ATP-grasp domain-containing protein [Actinomadura litoris]